MLTPALGSTTTVPPAGVLVRLMSNQTVLNTVGVIACPSPGLKNHTFQLISSASITGAVTLESAPDPTYTGAWSPLAAAIDVATIGPAAAGVLEVTFANRVFVAVRARISTVIAGGNLTVNYIGAK